MAESVVPNIDVLVVGAGPVGLFLAYELAKRKHRVRIIEQHDGQSTHSKAIGIMPRTMECFEMAGLGARFEAAVNRVDQIRVVAKRRTLAHVPFAPEGTRYPYLGMLAQDQTEQFLLEALRAHDVDIEYRTTLKALKPLSGGVEFTLQNRIGTDTLVARYLVGCDGTHSTVRKLSKIPFEGEEYRDTFVLCDVEMSGDLAASEMQICPHESGPLAIFPLSPERRRIVALVSAVEKTAPDLEAANRLLTERGPADVTATALNWSSIFYVDRRQVPSMRDRSGSVFLAGDAAHVHSPFGAQGMNTGLQDVWNLAWKLDFMLRGRSNDTLAASYSTERHPVAENVIRSTHYGTVAMKSQHALARVARSVAIPLLTRLDPVRDALVRTLSELDVRIPESPIVTGQGRRAADVLIRDGDSAKRLYDMLDARYLLLRPSVVDDADRDAFASVAQRFPVALQIVHRAEPDDKRLTLVRPDGYIAWESTLTPVTWDAVTAVSQILQTHLTPWG